MESAPFVQMKWNDHPSAIVKVLVQYLMKQEHVDVTLSCEGQLLKAHKIILSARSPYFNMIFRSHQQTDVVVIVNSMPMKHLKILVEFMYSGELKVMQHELKDVLRAAEQLQIKVLCDVLPNRNKQSIVVNANGANHQVIPTSNAQDTAQPQLINGQVDILAANRNLVIPPQEQSISKEKQSNNGKETSPKIVQLTNNNKNKSPKIRRPPNAFMVFANQWRRKLATENKADSNKQISVRLGLLWRNLADPDKEVYYKESRRMEYEHKRKYPGYYYSPMEARERKRKRIEGIIQRKQSMHSPNELPACNSIIVIPDDDGPSTSIADRRYTSVSQYNSGIPKVLNISRGVTSVIEPHLLIKTEC